MKLFRHHNIDLVFDVGANIGQYAQELRRYGYRGRIVSFEPLASAYAALSARSRTDHDWTAVHVALGEEPGTKQINVSANSQSSSLLKMLPAHQNADATSRYIGTETISTVTLDSLFPVYLAPSRRPFLKIDTQGYECQVLAGGQHCMGEIRGVQLEMSLVELYAGSPLYREIIERMLSAGFALVGLEPGFADPETGCLLQFDGIFFRVNP